MSAKELKLDGGLTDMRVNETQGYLAITIEGRRSFKGDKTSIPSMLAMLDRNQQHMLFMYLQERLWKATEG